MKLRIMFLKTVFLLVLSWAFVAAVPGETKAQETGDTLAIPDVAAFPSRSVNVSVELENVTEMQGLEFSLLFNPSFLSFTGVSTTGRTDGFIVDGEVLGADTLKVVMTNVGPPVSPGTGNVASIEFDVSGGGQVGETTTLDLVDALLVDPSGVDVTPGLIDGSLTIVNAILSAGEAIGVPGTGADGAASVPINLANSDDVQAIQFDLEFDGIVLTVTDARTTSRTNGWEIGFNESGVGIVSIAMTNIGPPLSAGDGPILEVEFAVSPEAPIVSLGLNKEAEKYGEGVDISCTRGVQLQITVSNALISDPNSVVSTPGTENGFVEIVAGILSVPDITGIIGTSDNLVRVNLVNGVPAQAIEFDLIYDSSTISPIIGISGAAVVEPGDRTHGWEIAGQVSGDTLRIAMANVGPPLDLAAGSIVEIPFQVGVGAEVVTIVPVNGLVSDPETQVFPLAGRSGKVTVVGSIVGVAPPGGGGEQGRTGLVPIGLANITPVQGMQFEVVFDPTVLSPIPTPRGGVLVNPGERTRGFIIEGGVPTDATDRINVLITNVGPPLSAGTGLVAVIPFLVNETAEVGSTTPIDIENALLSDPNSVVTEADVVSGDLTVFEPRVLGDVSGNGVTNVGDLIRVIGIILRSGVPPTLEELVGADVNLDGRINVRDLIAIINIILGTNTSAVLGLDGTFEVSDVRLGSLQSGFTGNAVLPFNAKLTEAIAGIELSFAYDSSVLSLSEPILGKNANAMAMSTNMKDGELSVLIYSFQGRTISFGDEPLLTLPVEVLGGYKSGAITLKNAVFVNSRGAAAEFGSEELSASPPLPKAYSLGQNFPNPFNPSTTISFSVPEGVDNGVNVRLEVYNVRGQMIKALVDGAMGPGSYSVVWDGMNDRSEIVSSGIYFYRLTAGEFTGIRKMVVLK